MKKYIILSILLCCGSAYPQLSNQLNKTVDGIATVRNNSTLLDSSFFTSTYSQAIFDIIGRFKNEQVNALDYGSTKNSTTIDAAIAAIDSGIVFLPAGTWDVSTFINLKSRIILEGAGPGVTILDRATFNTSNAGILLIGEIINGDNEQDSLIVIRNLTIQGHAKNNGGYTEFEHGIKIQGGSKIWIDNVEIRNVGGDAIIIEKQEEINKSIWITNCVINVPNVTSSPDTLVGRNGISVTGGKDIWIVNNHILDGGSPGGIDIEPTSPDSISNVHILNNIITSQGSASIGVGIHITSSAANPSKQISIIGNDVSNYNIGIRTTGPDSSTIIRNNRVYDNTTDGILLTTTNNAVIEGNYLYSNTNNGLHATGNQSNLHIKNNYSFQNGTAGFILAGTSGNELTQIILTGNIAYDNSQTTDNTSAGFDVNFVDSLVMKNNISYVNIATVNDQQYGLSFQNCDGIILQNNITWNNQTAEGFNSGNTNISQFANRLGWTGGVEWSHPGNINFSAISTNNIIFTTNSTEAARFNSLQEFDMQGNDIRDVAKVYNTNSENMIIEVTDAFALILETTDIERMRILSGGAVVINNTLNFAADAQADDDYEIAIPSISALTTGLMVTFTATTLNTGGATLEITSVGDIDALLKGDGNALVTGDITAGLPITAFFNAAGNWIIMSRLASD